jgi:hypothetical protein
MMIDLTPQEEENFYNRALELAPRLRSIQGRLDPQRRSLIAGQGLGRDVNTLVSNVSRAIWGGGDAFRIYSWSP